MSDEDLQRMSSGCGEDAAPYVLGALTDDEQADFLVHLDSCAICRDEVAALESVASVLPAAVPQLTAPDELKRRVMSTVRSEARLRGAEESVHAPRHKVARSFRWGGRSALVPVGALAAAVIAIALISSGSSGGGSTRVIRAQVTLPRAAVSVRLNGGHAELTLARMPQSPPGHVYEVWVKRGGAPQPTDALFTVSSAGSATVGVPGSVAGVKQILVTAEPTGGSKVPTSAPVILANLS
jgi:anti-sigma-K factor RskA